MRITRRSVSTNKQTEECPIPLNMLGLGMRPSQSLLETSARAFCPGLHGLEPLLLLWGAGRGACSPVMYVAPLRRLLQAPGAPCNALRPAWSPQHRQHIPKLLDNLTRRNPFTYINIPVVWQLCACAFACILTLFYLLSTYAYDLVDHDCARMRVRRLSGP